MCLLAVLFGVHPATPLVVAANRDERYARPAEPIQVLRPAAPRVLGGRDAVAGGTWLAVNEHGVFAGVTNRPSAEGVDPSRRSRGELPLIAVGAAGARDAVAALRDTVRCADYNPCWLLVGDRGSAFYVVVGDRDRPDAVQLRRGIHVLENCPLDAASPKMRMVQRKLDGAAHWPAHSIVERLHAVLRAHDHPQLGPDADADDLERRRRQIEAACVHSDEYGTRSATVIVVPPEPDRPPSVHYADGPPCAAPFTDATSLWRDPPDTLA